MKTTKTWNKMLMVGMFGVILVFGFSLFGCASQPKTPATMQAGAAVLGGKSAVIIPITLAQRSKAQKGDQQRTNLTDIVTPGLWAMTVNSFAKSVDGVVERNSTKITKKLQETLFAFVNSYNSTYNTALKEAAFDFGKKVPDVDYFIKPGKDVVTKITKVCSDNNAEFAITILYQFVDGPIVTAITQEDTTKLHTNIVVFDKTGRIVAVNNGQTGSATYRFVYLRNQMSTEEIIALHDDLMAQLYDALGDVIVNFVSVL